MTTRKTPTEQLEELAAQMLVLAKANNIPIVHSMLMENKTLRLTSWLPQGSPGRMYGARDMLIAGAVVYSDTTFTGDKDYDLKIKTTK